MLFNFESLMNLNAENAIGIIIGFGIFIFVAVGSYILYNKDKIALLMARYDALNKYFDKSILTQAQEKGFLAQVRKFFSEVSKKGFIGKAENDQKLKDKPLPLNERIKTEREEEVEKKAEVKEKPKINGYHVLSKKDEKELKILYGTIKHEALPIYGEKKVLEMFKEDLMQSKALFRRTTIYLENLREDQQDTFLGLLVVSDNFTKNL